MARNIASAAHDGGGAAVSGNPIAGPARGKRVGVEAKEKDLRIYQHSNLFYWWVVWAYGLLCAAITYAQGIGIHELARRTEAAEKVVLFHASPWLGISFIGVVLF